MNGRGEDTTIAVAVENHTTTEYPLEYLDIELTERCNLCCPHCYIRRSLCDQKARDNEMSTGFIKKLLDEAVSLGCSGVRFTGGEPLARKDFSEIYLYAHGLGLKVSVATNLTLITDEIADMFASHLPELISTSLYGWDEESYAKSVGLSGYYAKFLAGVNRIRQRKITLKLKYPPTKFLVDNSAKLQVLAGELGFPEELPYAWELTMHSRNDVSARERIKACRMCPEEAAVQRLRDKEITEHDKQALIDGRKKFTGKIFNCRAARKRLSVDAYGQLQVCLEVRHPATTYELRTGSLKDALLKHLPSCRQLRFTNPLYLDRCGKCVLRPACPLCPACSWMECGDLEVISEYHCLVMHAEARLLGFINNHEKGWEIQTLRKLNA